MEFLTKIKLVKSHIMQYIYKFSLRDAQTTASPHTFCPMIVDPKPDYIKIEHSYLINDEPDKRSRLHTE